MGKDDNGYSLYRKNDSRVIGHNKTVQVVSKTHKAIDGKFWGKAQVIKLPVKCEGPPNITRSLHKTGVQVAGQHQFMRIVTLLYRVAKVRVRWEKKATTCVCDDMSHDSGGSNVDSDQDVDDVGGNMDPPDMGSNQWY